MQAERQRGKDYSRGRRTEKDEDMEKERVVHDFKTGFLLSKVNTLKLQAMENVFEGRSQSWSFFWLNKTKRTNANSWHSVAYTHSNEWRQSDIFWIASCQGCLTKAHQTTTTESTEWVWVSEDVIKEQWEREAGWSVLDPTCWTGHWREVFGQRCNVSLYADRPDGCGKYRASSGSFRHICERMMYLQSKKWETKKEGKKELYIN